MMLPFLVHSTMGPASPFAREHVPSDVYGAQTTLSTYDALAEIAWLALPAIFVILVLKILMNYRIKFYIISYNVYIGLLLFDNTKNN